MLSAHNVGIAGDALQRLHCAGIASNGDVQPGEVHRYMPRSRRTSADCNTCGSPAFDIRSTAACADRYPGSVLSLPARRNDRTTCLRGDRTRGSPFPYPDQYSRGWVLTYDLQRSHASASPSGSSEPPCCFGTICSTWKGMRSVADWGMRQYSHAFRARSRTNSRTR